MKKRLNGKIKKDKRKIITLIVILVFLLYICLALIVSNRKYLYIESVFKNISSSVNEFFINNAYSKKGFSNNIINSKVKYLEKENNKLRDALALSNEKQDYITAEIVNHTSKTWFDKVQINVGYKDNVLKDLPVINSEGLIGFVSKTSKNTSEIRLLTSVNDDGLLSVMIETKDGAIAGVLSDYDVKKGLFKISDVTNKNNVLAGDRVVLSGYDNELYKGIYVGRVVKEENSNYGLSRTIWVESSVNFDDLLFVALPVKEALKWL